MYVTPFNCRPKPQICRLKPVICRPAQEHSRHEPVMDCRPEPPCVVTDIPKRESYDKALHNLADIFCLKNCGVKSQWYMGFICPYALWG